MSTPQQADGVSRLKQQCSSLPGLTGESRKQRIVIARSSRAMTILVMFHPEAELRGFFLIKGLNNNDVFKLSKYSSITYQELSHFLDSTHSITASNAVRKKAGMLIHIGRIVPLKTTSQPKNILKRCIRETIRNITAAMVVKGFIIRYLFSVFFL